MRKNTEIPRDFFESEDEQELEIAAPARRSAPAGDEAKIQVTIYLTEAAAFELEKIRYALMMEHGIKASKSAIAQYAIETVAKDMDAVAQGIAH